MKILFTILATLMMTSAFAEEVCTGAYAKGLGHLFKGEARTFVEEIKLGETYEDEIYKVKVSKKKGELVLDLREKATNKKVEVKKTSDSAATFFATASLKQSRKYPQDFIVGPGEVFLIFLCVDQQ